MDYAKAINLYANGNYTCGIDYSLQDDGDGVYISRWEIDNIPQPTIQQLQALVPDEELENLREQKHRLNEFNYDTARNGVQVINGVRINIDTDSCTNIVGQITGIMYNASTGGQPINILWFDDYNAMHEYTQQEFITLGQIVSQTVFLLQQKLSNNKVAIHSATSIDMLNNINMDYDSLIVNS